MTKNEVLAALGYKPTPIGGLTALGHDNDRGGISAAEFRTERGSSVLARLVAAGLPGVLRACGRPGFYHVVTH